MANYKVKENYKGTGTSFHGGYFIRWDNASQEELAHIYEDINGGKSFVDKLDKTEDVKKAKKSGKKSAKEKDSTEETE